LIDDEPSFTRVLKMNLEKTGAYEVREENIGLRGIESAKEFKPDVILLDIVMPDIDGGAILSEIRSSEDARDTKVLFLTAVLTKEEQRQKQGYLSNTPCLAKPVSIKEVVDFIEKNAQK